MKDQTPMERVFDEIRTERKKQFEKWGDQKHNDFVWLAILTEEVGELAETILHDQFGGYAAGKAKEELLHIAAVAVQWLEHKGEK